jgi:hypothetical protein
MAKAGVVVGGAGAGPMLNVASKQLNSIITDSSKNSDKNIAHPESPTEGPTGSFSPSSPLEDFDLLTFFGVDSNNHFLGLVFSIFALCSIITFFIYILSVYLLYIYLYNNNKLNIN